ncbi:MAG: hypothetical protein ACPGVB_10950 [Chitinophagales bacterium]
MGLGIQRERVIIVTAKTRLENLKVRFNTISQAKFYLERQGSDFDALKKEDSVMNFSVEQVQKDLQGVAKTKVISKEFLPNYIFSNKDIVVVVGQDGLVANTAKYAHGIPIIGVNPDPTQYDGVLLPFQTKDIERIVEKTLASRYSHKEVTMAEARLNDGQRLLAFNDLFIGPQSHRSARYNLTFNKRTESQSSSGIIVSTGAGSTGWLSSLINMANGIASAFPPQIDELTGRVSSTRISKRSKSNSSNLPFQMIPQEALPWNTDKLVFVVREPFRSRTSNISMSAGLIHQKEHLKVESLMPQGGVIFSDGIEEDFLQFTAGTIAEVGVAKERAHLVVS